MEPKARMTLSVSNSKVTNLSPATVDYVLKEQVS